MQPTVRVNSSSLASERGEVDVPLNRLEEREKASDSHLFS